MTRRLATLLALAALAIAACGEPADSGNTTEPGGTVPPTDGTTEPTNPPATADPMDVADTSWVVVSFGLDGADDAVLADHDTHHPLRTRWVQVSGTSGCNSYGGTTVFSGEAGIAFGDLAWTEMACMDDGVMDQEQRFFQALARIDGFALSADSLVLDAADGSAVIRAEAFDAGPVLPLAGDWRLTTFIDEDVALSVLAGTEITMTLDADAGTVSGHAGCNGFSGSVITTSRPGPAQVPPCRWGPSRPR